MEFWLDTQSRLHSSNGHPSIWHNVIPNFLTKIHYLGFIHLIGKNKRGAGEGGCAYMGGEYLALLLSANFNTLWFISYVLTTSQHIIHTTGEKFGCR